MDNYCFFVDNFFGVFGYVDWELVFADKVIHKLQIMLPVDVLRGCQNVVHMLSTCYPQVIHKVIHNFY